MSETQELETWLKNAEEYLLMDKFSVGDVNSLHNEIAKLNVSMYVCIFTEFLFHLIYYHIR